MDRAHFLEWVNNELKHWFRKSHAIEPDRHYRTAGMGNGWTVGVDAFENGHVRVHVFRSPREKFSIESMATPPPAAPSTASDRCVLCESIADRQPHWRQQSGGGWYFGFQWHGATDFASSRPTVTRLLEWFSTRPIRTRSA